VFQLEKIMRLYLFQLGSLQPLGIPVPGYLIQTDEGQNALVDTGFPYAFVANPPNVPGPQNTKIVVREEDYVVNRLAKIGLSVNDINILVCTHFDPDHAGNHALFQNAEFVVQRAHYEAAKAGHARSQMTRAQWDAPDLHFRLVDGDTQLLPGIELIETSGHVVGHQSLLVRLPKTGPVLLAIDAIMNSAMTNADTRPLTPADEDETTTRASTRKLAELVAREGITLSIYGHDPQQWPTLRHAPDFYD